MGLTLIDAGVLIGFLDRTDAHHAASYDALTGALDRYDRIVLPASAYGEALVGPSRRGSKAVTVVEQLVERVPIEIEPLSQAIARTAAMIRAKHRSIRLPDALVIATAKELDADLLVTTDHGWPTRAKLGLRATITRL